MAEFTNRVNDTVITGTSDADTITNWGGSNVTINALGGNDLINNNRSVTINGLQHPEAVIIDADDGNDTVSNAGNNVTISTGDGNDSIYSWGNSVIIDAGDGNDTVSNSGNNVTISTGDGNDYISNGNEHAAGGNNLLIDGGNGNDTVCNVNRYDSNKENASKITVNGGDGNDYIVNGELQTLSGGYQFAHYSGDTLMLNGDAGNDTVINYGGSNVTLNGGAGDDAIVNYNGSNVTLNGGAGDDTLTGGSDTDTFVYESGNDVITNYSGEDTVYIAAGGIDSYSFSGADLIFHIGDNTLTLKSVKNHAITVKDSSGKTSTKIYGTGYSGAEVMKNFVQSAANSLLDGNQKLDEAVKACSQFNSLQDVIDNLLSDLRKAGDADTFLRDYCGIFLDNKDTGAVTGWDAGGLTVKTTNDMFPESSASYPSSTSFTKRGLTLTVPEKSTLTEEEQNVVQSLYSGDVENSLKLIEETYGVKFTDNPLSIPLSIVYMPNYVAAAWTIGTELLTINLSKGYGGGYIISHELTHVVQHRFGFLKFMSKFMFEGMADVTAGTDDSSDYKTLAENPTKLAQYLNLNNSFSEDFNVYTAGVIFWRYLMRQAADNYDSTAPNAWDDNVNIQGTTAGELLTGKGTNSTISAGGGNDTVTAYGKNMQLVGGAGNDQIFIGDNSSGKILYASGDGNDTISGFNSNYTLEISGGTYTTQTSGSNVIVKVGDDSITLKNAKDISLNIKGTQGNSSTSTTTGGSSTSTTTGGSSTSTTSGSSSTSTTKSNGSAISSVWDRFYSGSTTTGSSSTSTTRGGSSSTSTTRSGSSSTSTTIGSSSTSTTRGGSSSTSTTTGGSSTSTTRGGSSSTSTVDNNQIVYAGGNQIVSNYAGEKIVFGDMYTGATFSGNSFFVNSSTGTLVIENVTDKIVDLRDNSGGEFIKAYTPSTAGVIDGRGLAGFEIINGSSTGTDVIFAGDGGSSLWGGSGDIADALVGGGGTDIFSGGRFQGSDNFMNVSSADVVNLTDASLSDIVAAVGDSGNVLIGFNTGNIISIQSTGTLSAAINLADGSSWRFNHSTKAWQSA